MKVTRFTREALEFRREQRRLERLGYVRHETDWQLHRGYVPKGTRIIDAKVSCDGMYVYTLLGKQSSP